MIEETDRQLVEWVETVVGGVEVRLGAPVAGTKGAGVGLYLLDLLHTPPSRNSRRLSLQVSLRYLVTTRSEDPMQAHQLLGDLVFAAMESADLEVELEPPPVQLWQAFQLPPQPCFMLRVPIRLDRRVPEGGRITQPVELRHLPLVPLTGQVLGPGDVPVANAAVELPELRLATRTDIKGRFVFGAVPAGPSARHVRIRARGHETSTEVSLDGGAREPLTIHFHGLEV